MLQEKKINTLIDNDAIYLEPAVRNYERGNKILAKYQGAKLIEVPLH